LYFVKKLENPEDSACRLDGTRRRRAITVASVTRLSEDFVALRFDVFMTGKNRNLPANAMAHAFRQSIHAMLVLPAIALSLALNNRIKGSISAGEYS
jgi:hypothetical protein